MCQLCSVGATADAGVDGRQHTDCGHTTAVVLDTSPSEPSTVVSADSDAHVLGVDDCDDACYDERAADATTGFVAVKVRVPSISSLRIALSASYASTFLMLLVISSLTTIVVQGVIVFNPSLSVYWYGMLYYSFVLLARWLDVLLGLSMIVFTRLIPRQPAAAAEQPQPQSEHAACSPRLFLQFLQRLVSGPRRLCRQLFPDTWLSWTALLLCLMALQLFYSNLLFDTRYTTPGVRWLLPLGWVAHMAVFALLVWLWNRSEPHPRLPRALAPPSQASLRQRRRAAALHALVRLCSAAVGGCCVVAKRPSRCCATPAWCTCWSISSSSWCSRRS